MTDISILAATAYETGIDPIDYATENVIRAHVNMYLGLALTEIAAGRNPPTAALSRRILGDLMDAGWTPPEVTG